MMCQPVPSESNLIFRFAKSVFVSVIIVGCSAAEEGTNTLGKAVDKKPSTTIDVSSEGAIDYVVAANNAFGFDLYRALAGGADGKNLFFSPYSIENALAMTLGGARGDTADEMGAALRFSNELRRSESKGQDVPWQTQTVHQGFSALNELLAGADPEVTSAARAEILQRREQFDVAQARVLELSNEGNWKELHEAQGIEADAAAALNAAMADVDQYELRIANSLWGEKTYPFEPDFVKTIERHYGAGGLFPADFKNDFVTERPRMNLWVEQKTNGRIKGLVPPLPPSEARRLKLVLINAIYFKGDWSEPFEEASTKDRPFFLANGATVNTPLMQNRELTSGRYLALNGDGSVFDTPERMQSGQTTGLYPDDLGFAVLALPYKGDELSMLLIAPNAPEGLTAVEQMISATSLDGWVSALRPRKTHVLVPRFKLEETYTLKASLQSMGMKSAFDPRVADFKGLTTSTDPKDRLSISRVIHKAFLEVSEKGTEAAAATAVMMVTPTSVPQTFPFTPVFRADRPFLFLIRDRRTGAVLFLGRLSDPRL